MIVTDGLVLGQITREGLNADDVEFWHDYAPRGEEYNPYAKFYRHTKSNKKFMAVSGLPKVNADGVKICGNSHNETTVGWELSGSDYITKPNIFGGVVSGIGIELTVLNDQPTGLITGNTSSWEPQLFVKNKEKSPNVVTLLATDPTNPSYHNNVLEWDYGVCLRRIRVIEGRLRERWIFYSDPAGTVTIKHNFSGDFQPRIGYAMDAAGNSLQITVVDDEEVIVATEFDNAAYPIEIGASPETFYPDEGVASVDGLVTRTGVDETFHNLVSGVGVGSWDNGDNFKAELSASTTNNQWKYMGRSIILFDTSGLPDAANVTGATLTLYGSSSVDNLNVLPTFNIYSSDPFSNTALQADDYVDVGTTALCDTAIARADWKNGTPGDPNDFVLNAAGITTDTQLNRDGVSKYGLRNANYEVADELDPGNHDPAWVNNQGSGIDPWATEKGAGYKPTLIVTYSTGWTGIAMGVTNPGAVIGVDVANVGAVIGVA